jgi:hypothetical protein
MRTAAGVTLLASALAGPGCSTPTNAPPPPGGGTTLTLDFDEFQANVEPVLTARGCDAGGDCHGGGIRGSLELSPAGAKDARFDFDQVKLQVSATDAETSPILTEPLALDQGGTPHGYKVFATTADTGYAAILLWIRHGVRS